MTWGIIGNIITTNLDDGTDSPASAREDLRKALVELKNVINGLNTSGGAAKLDATTTRVIANSGVQATTDLTLSPGSGYTVNVGTGVINLEPKTVAELNALTAEDGDVAFCSNGDAGARCLAVYSEADSTWKRISLGTTISAT